MKIIISNSSRIPIYEQIKNTIISQIMSDELSTGELLPSIRNLAKDIKISVMTIKKAYDELEMEGYIKTVLGKGSFISDKSTDLLRESANKEIEKYISKIIEISNKYSITKEEILDIFEYLYKEES